jgi:hypothetical protein
MPAQIVPNENMCFDSHEEAYKFYFYYARMARHGVRIPRHILKWVSSTATSRGNENFTNEGREETRDDITEDMLQGFCDGEME